MLSNSFGRYLLSVWGILFALLTWGSDGQGTAQSPASNFFDQLFSSKSSLLTSSSPPPSIAPSPHHTITAVAPAIQTAHWNASISTTPKSPIELGATRWCGGAPAEFLPWKSMSPDLVLRNYVLPTVPTKEYLNATRMLGRLIGPKPKFSSGRFGCSRTRGSVQHENEGSGQKVHPTAPEDLSPAQRKLLACLKDISKCDLDAAQAASHLTSIQTIIRQPSAKLGRHHKFKSCALVGNAGHMVLKRYGPYIDRHEAVVRFNGQELGKFAVNVGSKTTIRVLNHARSRIACCPGGGGKLPDKGDLKKLTFLLWHAGGQREIIAACKRRYRKTWVTALSRKFILGEVAVMQALRRDLKRFGFTEFNNWRQLTSGGHAILLMTRMCEKISLYGFTTYPPKVPVNDQYGGRAKKSSSGKWWHDWIGESYAWRLLHAAGKATICSM